MQKKLYFLNEEEKNRILGLHESRTKKQYLMEQSEDLKEIIQGLNDVVDEVSGFSWKYGKFEIFSYDQEKNYKIYFYQTNLAQDSILRIIKGFSKDSELIKQSKQKGFFPKGCWEYYPSDKTLRLFNCKMKTSREKSTSYNSFIYKKLSLDQVDTIQADTEQTTSEWPKEFECVKSYKDSEVTYENEKWKKVIRSWGSEYFSSGGLYYKYKDKEEIPKGNNNYYTYYCTGGKPYYKTTIVNKGESSEDTSTGGGSGTGGGGLQPGQWKSLSPQYDEKILKAIGKEGKTLTDDDIKTLYNKLKSAGKI